MRLIEIEETGKLSEKIVVDDFLREVIEATVACYRRIGFVPPWIGYITIEDSVPVGTCAFKSPPVDGRVEIAYFTLPGFEGQGIATSMARELVRTARQEDNSLTVFAQTTC